MINGGATQIKNVLAPYLRHMAIDWFEKSHGDTQKSRSHLANWSEGINRRYGVQVDPEWRKKSCLMCMKDEKPDAKFQYCAKCRSVCYCSKECQKAHWRDHKLACSKY